MDFMESRWYIPPFRGKAPAKLFDIPNEMLSSSDDGISSRFVAEGSDLVPEVKRHDLAGQKMHVDELEDALKELEEQHKMKMNAAGEEREAMLAEIQRINESNSKSYKFKVVQDKINSQLKEMEDIRQTIEDVKNDVEKIHEVEEALYFKMYEEKKKLKYMREDFIQKEKVFQIGSAENKNVIKEKTEKNENLESGIKLELEKSEILKEFIEKALRKKDKAMQGDYEGGFNRLKSEFRIVQMQIAEIDKQINDIQVVHKDKHTEFD